MRSAVALLVVSLMTISALSMVDFSSADVSDSFNDEYFTFSVVNVSEVVISGFDENYPDPILDIPSIANDGTSDYTVIGIDVQLYSEDVTTINIPSSIRAIADGCFSLDNLEHINVDVGNTHFVSIEDVLYGIRDSVPYKLVVYPINKDGDEYLSMPSSVSEIAAGAFSGSDLRVIKLSDSIIKIGTGAFYNCTSLENIRSDLGDNSLPSSVSNIGSSAFSNCINLNSLTLSYNLEYIGPFAFDNCGFTSMNIPLYVDYIGAGAFSDCARLETITSDNFTYVAEDGILYTVGKNDTKSLFVYPCAKSDKTTYEMPDDVVDIESYAFSGCSKLKTVVLNNRMVNIPDTAFFDCTSLETIDLKNAVTIGVAAFNGCVNLKNIEFGKNLLTIGDASFYRSGVETLVIPSNVVHIGYNAFGSCNNLKYVTIEEGSKATICGDAFIYDTNIQKITISSADVVLDEGALSIAGYDETFTLSVEVVKGYEVPSNAANEETTLNITIIGERPYPWENWIGVFFCVLVVIGILWAVREV